VQLVNRYVVTFITHWRINCKH